MFERLNERIKFSRDRSHRVSQWHWLLFIVVVALSLFVCFRLDYGLRKMRETQYLTYLNERVRLQLETCGEASRVIPPTLKPKELSDFVASLDKLQSASNELTRELIERAPILDSQNWLTGANRLKREIDTYLARTTEAIQLDTPERRQNAILQAAAELPHLRATADEIGLHLEKTDRVRQSGLNTQVQLASAIILLLILAQFYMVIRPTIIRLTNQNQDFKNKTVRLQKEAENIWDTTSQLKERFEKTEELVNVLKMEKLKAATLEAHRTEFLADVNHQLRTPLHKVYMLLGAVDQSSPSDIRSTLTNVRAHIENLKNVVDSLMALGSSPRPDLDESTTVIWEKFYSDLIESAQIASPGKIRWSLDAPVPTWMRIHSQSVRALALQVTDDLASSDGMLNVKVSWEPALHQLVFSYQSETANYPLSDITLKLLQSFPDRDTVGFEIKHGQIQLRFPVSEFGMSAEKQPEDILPGLRVLLVEDDAEIRDLTASVLKEAALRVDVADDGLKAFGKAHSEKYDVILMDIHIPVMNGFDTAKRLRESGIQIPIVALTARVLNDEAEAARSSGFQAFIAKPCTREQLLSTIARVLKQPKPSETQSAAIPDELRARFLTGLSTRIEDLSAACKDEHYERVWNVAHKLSGAASGYGYHDLAELSNHLQELAEMKTDFEKIRSLAERVKVEASDIREAGGQEILVSRPHPGQDIGKVAEQS